MADEDEFAGFVRAIAPVRVHEDGRLDPMYDLPADAQVVVPGGMIGD
jgi:hypothetical protein